MRSAIYSPSSSLAALEYQFDDGPVVKEDWGRFLIWPYAYKLGTKPDTALIDAMKTAKKLTYSFDDRTYIIDLTGAGNGVELFEVNCQGLTGSSV